MRLSVVTTLYRSAPYLPEFLSRVTAAVKKLTTDYEIVFVNDGSPDNALDVALGLQETESRLKIVDLSRNFGHHQAILTGLAHTTGDWVFLIDCDLEEDPELLEQFESTRRQSAADVVFGVQQSRKGGFVERWGGWLFYKLFNFLAPLPIPENLTTVRLMSRRYVDALLQHREVEFALSGLWARTGFAQVPVPVVKKQRDTSTYDFSRRLTQLLMVASFSAKPLYYIFYIGVGICALSVVAWILLLIRGIFGGAESSGWPSIMVSIWFLGGLVIAFQGVIGFYLYKIFMETKRRPIAIIRQIYEASAEARAADNRNRAELSVTGLPRD